MGSFWLYLAGMGFFPSILAYLLYTKGLEEVESSRAAIVATIEPVVGTLVVFLFQGNDVWLAASRDFPRTCGRCTDTGAKVKLF